MIKMERWEAERVQRVGSRKHINCMVGIDEKGVRHYMPLKSSWVITQKTTETYEKIHVSGIDGCPGVSKEEVENMSDADLRKYWRS